ncbi:putative transporter [Porphyromonas sp.]|uniref:putative transporter n=1 Tax=Porphyromonas sp. TaxID=1924944 RepID=UPI0026DBB111|nr:putative transporter [Porphyromonas sp.]MDO4771081.1 putative transporter [Porphyromonas sp.]
MVQTLMLICLVSGIGLYLGKLKISRFTLGSACVFFVGILAAHFGAKVNDEMLHFAQNFGLILFVYALGVQVGPGFVASFRRKGLALNMWGLSLILLSTLGVVALYYATDIGIELLMGVLSGAVTNTPALGAAQQAVIQSAQSPDISSLLSDMALATAITYPFGIIGVIIVLEILKKFFAHKDVAIEGDEPHHFVGEYYVRNPEIAGKTVAEIHELVNIDFIISRLWRHGKIFQPSSDTVLELEDHLIIVSDETDAPRITGFFGGRATEKEQVDWESDKEIQLVSRRLLVTKSEFNGVKLSSLRLRNRYGVNVTRINRAEIDLVPTPMLRLQIGDRLTVVGRSEDVERLAKRIGDQLKPLDTPYLISIFLGIFLGCALGSIPIILPGISNGIKLGIAGGPIIVGILMGAYGSRLKLNTYITQSANLMVRSMGIVIYLACLGLSSGANFFTTLTEGGGLVWLGLGAILTVVPTLLVGFMVLKYTDYTFGAVGGLLCGTMANPIALDYLNAQAKDDVPTVSYASVYPLSMFLRVIIAQLVVSVVLS